MSDTTDAPDLKSVNSIAYDASLREQLEELHKMLGLEITDVATGAMEFGIKFNGDGERVLKFLSKMASQLSIALIEAKKQKVELTVEEKEDFERIKSLTAVLGNVQDKLNRVLKTSKEILFKNEEIGKQGMDLAEYIMDAQEQFRNVRASINAFGFLSNNPELAKLFDEQNGSNGEKKST